MIAEPLDDVASIRIALMMDPKLSITYLEGMLILIGQCKAFDAVASMDLYLLDAAGNGSSCVRFESLRKTSTIFTIAGTPRAAGYGERSLLESLRTALFDGGIAATPGATVWAYFCATDRG